MLATFAIQGVMIGLAGTLLGAALGTLLSHNLRGARRTGSSGCSARSSWMRSVYYMSDLPAYVEGIDVLRICGVAFVLCALATIYPAWRASRTAPARGAAP